MALKNPFKYGKSVQHLVSWSVTSQIKHMSVTSKGHSLKGFLFWNLGKYMSNGSLAGVDFALSPSMVDVNCNRMSIFMFPISSKSSEVPKVLDACFLHIPPRVLEYILHSSVIYSMASLCKSPPPMRWRESLVSLSSPSRKTVLVMSACNSYPLHLWRKRNLSK